MLTIRKLSKRWLAMLVFATGGALFGYAITNEYDNLGAGWTFGNYGFWDGLLRVMFAFPAGLLLSHVFRKRKVRVAFWWCALIIVAVTVPPRLDGESQMWANGIYEALCVLLFSPLVKHLPMHTLGAFLSPVVLQHRHLVCVQPNSCSAVGFSL